MATLATAPVEAPAASARAPRWPFFLYALTGFTGVLAEQGFEKHMSLLVGATAAASTVVIFAYFLGFALGSWAIGTFVRRGSIRQPLRLYGVLELLVGISCVAFSYSFHPIMAVLAPWQALYANPLLKFAVRFAFGSILIVPAAALMGASFPLIACAVDRSNDSQGRSWLRAYALNLTGAVLAALSGAYVILPLAGIRGALWLCFGICAFVFVGCQFATPGNARLVATEDRQTSARLDRDARILLTGAFASGFVFFALEVLWTHLIGIAVGGSVYAFSAMLTMVLLGLLIGAFRVDRMSRKQAGISYSRIFQLAALLLVIQLRMWDWGQAVFIIDLPAPLQNFFAVETIKLALAAVLIVPSAAMLGAIYPSLLRSPVLERPGYSYLVGYVNTWNSLGCLMGAVAGIFFLIPVLGAEWSLKLIIVTALAVSLLFLWRENPSRKALNKALAGVAIVLLYAALCKWDKRLIASGMNVYFGQVAAPDSAKQPEGPRRDAELIFFDESAQGGITSVVEFTDLQSHAKERVLLTNGKYEGSDDLDNQGRAQIGFAAIPSMFNAETGRALLIGLGTGHSALALTRLGYREVDVAEFAPGIIRASRQAFPRLTEGALDFPNVSLKLEDGRNLLLTNPRARLRFDHGGNHQRMVCGRDQCLLARILRTCEAAPAPARRAATVGPVASHQPARSGIRDRHGALRISVRQLLVFRWTGNSGGEFGTAGVGCRPPRNAGTADEAPDPAHSGRAGANRRGDVSFARDESGCGGPDAGADFFARAAGGDQYRSQSMARVRDAQVQLQQCAVGSAQSGVSARL